MGNEKDVLYGLSKEEKKKLLAKLQEEEKNERIEKREAYEGLRAEFMHSVEEKLEATIATVKGFKDWLDKEADAFVGTMRD